MPQSSIPPPPHLRRRAPRRCVLAIEAALAAAVLAGGFLVPVGASSGGAYGRRCATMAGALVDCSSAPWAAVWVLVAAAAAFVAIMWTVVFLVGFAVLSAFVCGIFVAYAVTVDALPVVTVGPAPDGRELFPAPFTAFALGGVGGPVLALVLSILATQVVTRSPSRGRRSLWFALGVGGVAVLLAAAADLSGLGPNVFYGPAPEIPTF